MRFGGQALLIFAALVMGGLWSSPAVAQADAEDVDQVVRYRFKHDFSIPLETGRRLEFLKGEVFWLEATSEDGDTYFIRNPANTKGNRYPVQKVDFERVLEPSHQVSRVLKGITTEQGVVIKPGTVIIEHSFDNSSVSVTIEGDTSGAVYEVPKAKYREKGTIDELDRAPLVAPPPVSTSREQYRIRTKFSGLLAVRSGQPAIDLNANDEVEVVGEGSGKMSWATKVKILKGPSQGQEFYMSGRLLRNPLSATQLDEDDEGTVEVAPPKAKKSAQVEMAPQRATVVDESKSNSKSDPKSSGHQKAPAVANLAGAKSINGIALEPVSDPADCMPRQDHKRRGTKHLEKKRKTYRAAILRAANAYDIPPAVLEASIHLETDMDEGAENLVEKRAAIAKYGSEAAAAKIYTTATKSRPLSDTWGKGICQFGPSDSHDFGLNWLAPKPKEFPVSAKYRKDNPNSVWDPEACLMGKARYMRRFKDRKDMTLKLANGKELSLNDYFFNRGPDKAAASYLTFFNRASRYRNAVQAYYSRHGKLPEDFGQAWAEEACTGPQCKPPQPKGTKVLNTQHIARVHVLNGAGLCSGAAAKNSFYGVYSKDYKQVPNAKGVLEWVSR